MCSAKRLDVLNDIRSEGVLPSRAMGPDPLMIRMAGSASLAMLVGRETKPDRSHVVP